MSETNFKVGDRVIGLRDYDIFKIKGIKGTVIYSNNGVCVEFDKNVNGHSGGADGLNGKQGHCVYCYGYVKLIEEDSAKEEIIIYRKNNEVIATQKRDGKFVDSAKAKCNTTDEFIFLKGAEIAFDRLIGKEDKKVREIERVAELGEYIRVTSTFGHPWELDSIHKVTGYESGGGTWIYVDGSIRGLIRDDQYVVLENYKPQQNESQTKEIKKLKEQIKKQKEFILENEKQIKIFEDDVKKLETIIEEFENRGNRKSVIKKLLRDGCPTGCGFSREYCHLSCSECWKKAIVTEL